jgi:hypothetical protein
MMANRGRVSFEPRDINTSVNSVTTPGFVQLANVPDKVWKKRYNANTAPYGRRGPENPGHYADLDYKPAGGQSLDELTPTASSLDPNTWRDYYRSIGWNTVAARGLLPFRVWQIYKQMVTYAAAGNVARFVTAAGVLAHYIGDACQTLHGSYLTDGDPFRHPDGSPSDEALGLGDGFGGGIHGAYEGDMLDANVDDLLAQLTNALGVSHGMGLIRGGREAGFATIELMRRTQERLDPMALVETYGTLVLEGRKSEAPGVLWDNFGDRTIETMADGCRTLAMLWESAWKEGDGNVPVSQLTTQSTARLKAIYEERTFLPSVPLGQIDQYL